MYVMHKITRDMPFSAPSGIPQRFEISSTGSRSITFSWDLPIIAVRNGNITSYNLTCVSTTAGSEAFLTRVYPVSESNVYTLVGFKPVTHYMCRVFAINSAGRGPEATINRRTSDDG